MLLQTKYPNLKENMIAKLTAKFEETRTLLIVKRKMQLLCKER